MIYIPANFNCGLWVWLLIHVLTSTADTVKAWVINYIPHNAVQAITYPCPNPTSTMLAKGVPGLVNPLLKQYSAFAARRLVGNNQKETSDRLLMGTTQRSIYPLGPTRSNTWYSGQTGGQGRNMAAGNLEIYIYIYIYIIMRYIFHCLFKGISIHIPDLISSICTLEMR